MAGNQIHSSGDLEVWQEVPHTGKKWLILGQNQHET